VAGLALAPLSACAPGDAPVVLGVAGPLSTPYGESTRLGAELARREVNEQGGIGGRRLELRFLDDGADPDRALAVADSLYRDPSVVAVVGPMNSGTTVHAADIYQRGLPAVATSATSAEVSRLGDWIFRVASSDSANSVELARYARRLDLRTAVLYENED
jgi:branched-chain amino acid transport system substrate-binding protein